MPDIYVSTLAFGTFFVAGVVALSCLGLALVRRFLPPQRLRPSNGPVGFLFTTTGGIYAVVLAFLVIVVWQSFTEAGRVVLTEIDALTDIAQNARVFTRPQEERIRGEILAYNRDMVDEEWPAMQHGSSSPRAESEAADIASEISNLTPRNGREIAVRGRLLQLTQAFLNARRDRLVRNRTGIAPILWVTMFAGAAITIVFAYLFGVQHAGLHYVLVSLLAATIALMLVLIIEVDFPFRGEVSVHSSVWSAQREFLEVAP
jgi:hypothetical protein